MYKAVILASGDVETGGGGETAKAILTCAALGLTSVKVEVIICNNSISQVPGFYQNIADYNQEFDDNVEVRTINRVRYPAGDREKVEDGAQTFAEAQACAKVMKETGAQLFIQAGFMKKTVYPLLEHDGINTHSGPLQFPGAIPGVDTKGMTGKQAQDAVINNNWPYSAHCVHKVAEDYDAGDFIDWRTVKVRSGDTPQKLYNRVREVEQANLPYDIEKYALSQGY